MSNANCLLSQCTVKNFFHPTKNGFSLDRLLACFQKMTPISKHSGYVFSPFVVNMWFCVPLNNQLTFLHGLGFSFLALIFLHRVTILFTRKSWHPVTSRLLRTPVSATQTSLQCNFKLRAH